MGRKLICALTAVVLSGTLAAPASAKPGIVNEPDVVTKSGSQTCTAGSYVSITGKGSGNLRFYWPSSIYRVTSFHGDVIYSTTYQTPYKSTTWKVTSDGYLDDVGTYAFCRPGAAGIRQSRSASLSEP